MRNGLKNANSTSFNSYCLLFHEITNVYQYLRRQRENQPWLLSPDQGPKARRRRRLFSPEPSRYLDRLPPEIVVCPRSPGYAMACHRFPWPEPGE